VNGSVTGSGNYVGALVGYIYDDAVISNCFADGSVTGGNLVGGLIGYSRSAYNESDYVDISNCVSLADVSGNNYVGGLAGEFYRYAYNSVNDEISNCLAGGRVSGTDNVGGLIGYARRGTTISNCAAFGVVSGGEYVTGLLEQGYIDFSCSTSNSYATGMVSGTDANSSGMIVNATGSTYENLVQDYQGTSMVSGNLITDRTTLEMTNGGIVAGLGGKWDFHAGYYPTPVDMLASSNKNLAAGAALAVVPIYLDAADTTASVTKNFTVPTTDAAGNALTWTAEPADMVTISGGSVTLNVFVKSGSDRIPYTGTDTISFTVYTSSSATLDLKNLQSGETERGTVSVNFSGGNGTVAFSAD
jgi:hypothetical protein